MKSYSERNASIFPPEPKPFKKKKEYISINGTVIKSTLDTGNSAHTSTGKKKKPKQIANQNQRRKKETSDLISPIQTQQEPLSYSPAVTRGVKHLPLSSRPRPIESPKRPFSLPLIEKKHLSLQGTERSHEQPIRSSTGDKLLRHPSSSTSSAAAAASTATPSLLTQTNSLNSLTLEIDIATDEVITKKEKRQWREFKTLTEDHRDYDEEGRGGDSSTAHLSDLVRLNSIGKGSSASVYKSVLFPSLQVVADKVVVLSNKAKSSQIISELKSLKTALQSDDSRDSTSSSDPSVAPSAASLGPSGGLSIPCGCECIVKLLEVYPNPRDGTISMCLEYMNGGSLQEVVRAGGCQNEDVLAGIAAMILTGIAHLHSRRQLHRDIKPGNILLSSILSAEPPQPSQPPQGEQAEGQGQGEGQRYWQGRVKISDFGLSKELEKGHSLADSFLGTFHYMSPERISGGDYSFPSDIWSFGMTILAVALGRYPFLSPPAAPKGGQGKGESQQEQQQLCAEVITEGDGGYWAILQAIQERPSIRSLLSSCQHNCSCSLSPSSAPSHSHFPPGFQGTHSSSSSGAGTGTGGGSAQFSKAFHSFLSQCLQKDPKQRPSALTLLQHPFFQSHPLSSLSSLCGSDCGPLLTPASHLTDDFIRQCCARHKEDLETKAISARNRMSHNSLFFNSSPSVSPSVSIAGVSGRVGEEPRSGERTADNNAANRRRIRKPLPVPVSVPSVGEGEGGGEGGGEEGGGEEGVKQLRIVIKAYREYLNRSLGRQIQTLTHSNLNPNRHSRDRKRDRASERGATAAEAAAAAEKKILTTLSPLLSSVTLWRLSEALNVQLPVLHRAFQKILRDLRDQGHLTTSLTTLLDKGFPFPFPSSEHFTHTNTSSSNSNTALALNFSTPSSPASVSAVSVPVSQPEAVAEAEDRDEREGDCLDRSDGSDTAAVAELRALMNTRSGPLASASPFASSPFASISVLGSSPLRTNAVPVSTSAERRQQPRQEQSQKQNHLWEDEGDDSPVVSPVRHPPLPQEEEEREEENPLESGEEEKAGDDDEEREAEEEDYDYDDDFEEVEGEAEGGEA